MRKRIALCMAALVLALLGPGMALVVSRSFGLTMERERARALGEEAAIARAVALETASNRFDRYEASTLQTRYSSKEMAVYLLRNGEPITGEALPEAEKLSELLNTTARATLLDRPGERLLIAHALGDGVLLLAALDVAPVYALRRALMRGAKRAAEEAEKGEACTKELKELAGILQTLAGLEKELGGGTAVQTVQVLMGEEVRALSE